MTEAAMARIYGNKSVEEIAAASVALGYNTGVWSYKTAEATQLRNLIVKKLATEWSLDTSNERHFELLIRLTNEAITKASTIR